MTDYEFCGCNPPSDNFDINGRCCSCAKLDKPIPAPMGSEGLPDVPDTDNVGVYRNSDGKWLFNIERQYLEKIIRPKCEYTFGQAGSNPPVPDYKSMLAEAQSRIASLEKDAQKTAHVAMSLIREYEVKLESAQARERELVEAVRRSITDDLSEINGCESIEHSGVQALREALAKARSALPLLGDGT